MRTDVSVARLLHVNTIESHITQMYKLEENIHRLNLQKQWNKSNNWLILKLSLKAVFIYVYFDEGCDSESSIVQDFVEAGY